MDKFRVLSEAASSFMAAHELLLQQRTILKDLIKSIHLLGRCKQSFFQEAEHCWRCCEDPSDELDRHIHTCVDKQFLLVCLQSCAKLSPGTVAGKAEAPRLTTSDWRSNTRSKIIEDCCRNVI